MSFWSDPFGLNTTLFNDPNAQARAGRQNFQTDQQNGQAAAEGGRNNLANQYPGMISYIPGYDPLSMSSQSGVESRLSGINMNTQGLDKFRSQALRTGPSKWANLQNQASFSEEQSQRERAKKEALSGAAQTQADLAMRGGLTSGARERADLSGQRNLIAMSQKAGESGAANRLQVGINDEQNRIGQLSQLPAMEQIPYNANMDKAKMIEAAHQTDIQNQMNEIGRQNAYNQSLNQNAANAWAGQQTNQAAQQQANKFNLFNPGTWF